jgi:Fic family protein
MNPKDFTNSASGRSFYTPNCFWAFIPAPLPPDLAWSTPLVSALSQAERDLSRLATITREFSIWQSLIQPFIRNEAVLSSRIEGTRTSLPDVYRYEAFQLPFLEQSEDAREVHNYVRAMEYGLARLASFPVSLRLIREIHQVLMDKVRGETSTPGEFRRSQNWIGPAGSTPSTAPYVPPPVDEMHLCLDALEKFIHVETLLPRLIQAGMIHYQFEAIHPFLDGNGRVGRLLVDLLMQEWGYLPQPALNLSVYLERNREAYYDHLLAVSQHGEWNEWLIFFLNGVSQQSNESEGRIRPATILPGFDHPRAQPGTNEFSN